MGNNKNNALTKHDHKQLAKAAKHHVSDHKRSRQAKQQATQDRMLHFYYTQYHAIEKWLRENEADAEKSGDFYGYSAQDIKRVAVYVAVCAAILGITVVAFVAAAEASGKTTVSTSMPLSLRQPATPAIKPAIAARLDSNTTTAQDDSVRHSLARSQSKSAKSKVIPFTLESSPKHGAHEQKTRQTTRIRHKQKVISSPVSATPLVAPLESPTPSSSSWTASFWRIISLKDLTLPGAEAVTLPSTLTETPNEAVIPELSLVGSSEADATFVSNGDGIKLMLTSDVAEILTHSSLHQDTYHKTVLSINQHVSAILAGETAINPTMFELLLKRGLRIKFLLEKEESGRMAFVSDDEPLSIQWNLKSSQGLPPTDVNIWHVFANECKHALDRMLHFDCVYHNTPYREACTTPFYEGQTANPNFLYEQWQGFRSTHERLSAIAKSYRAQVASKVLSELTREEKQAVYHLIKANNKSIYHEDFVNQLTETQRQVLNDIRNNKPEIWKAIIHDRVFIYDSANKEKISIKSKEDINYLKEIVEKHYQPMSYPLTIQLDDFRTQILAYEAATGTPFLSTLRAASPESPVLMPHDVMTDMSLAPSSEARVRGAHVLISPFMVTKWQEGEDGIVHLTITSRNALEGLARDYGHRYINYLDIGSSYNKVFNGSVRSEASQFYQDQAKFGMMITELASDFFSLFFRFTPLASALAPEYLAFVERYNDIHLPKFTAELSSLASNRSGLFSATSSTVESATSDDTTELSHRDIQL